MPVKCVRLQLAELIEKGIEVVEVSGTDFTVVNRTEAEVKQDAKILYARKRRSQWEKQWGLSKGRVR